MGKFEIVECWIKNLEQNFKWNLYGFPYNHKKFKTIPFSILRNLIYEQTLKLKFSLKLSQKCFLSGPSEQHTLRNTKTILFHTKLYNSITQFPVKLSYILRMFSNISLLFVRNSQVKAIKKKKRKETWKISRTPNDCLSIQFLNWTYSQWEKMNKTLENSSESSHKQMAFVWFVGNKIHAYCWKL